MHKLILLVWFQMSWIWPWTVMLRHSLLDPKLIHQPLEDDCRLSRTLLGCWWMHRKPYYCNRRWEDFMEGQKKTSTRFSCHWPTLSPSKTSRNLFKMSWCTRELSTDIVLSVLTVVSWNCWIACAPRMVIWPSLNNKKSRVKASSFLGLTVLKVTVPRVFKVVLLNSSRVLVMLCLACQWAGLLAICLYALTGRMLAVAPQSCWNLTWLFIRCIGTKILRSDLDTQNLCSSCSMLHAVLSFGRDTSYKICTL